MAEIVNRQQLETSLRLTVRRYYESWYQEIERLQEQAFRKVCSYCTCFPLACVRQADQGSRAKPQSLFAKMEASKKAESSTKPESSTKLESSTQPEEGGKDEDIL